MNTLEKIKNKTIELRKNRDPLSSTMLYHISQMENIGKNNGNRETTEDQVVQYLKKVVHDLEIDKFSNKYEEKFLKQFLPQMVSTEELIEFIDNSNTNSMKELMGLIKKEYGVMVDMREASKLVKEKLDVQ